MTYIVVTYSCSFTFFLFWFLLGLLAALSVMIYIAAYTGFFSSQWVFLREVFTAGRFFPWGAFDQLNSATKSFSVLTCPFSRVVVMRTKSVPQST